MRTATGGLLVNNKAAYSKYLKEKEQYERLNKLERDVSDIKDLLMKLVNK